MTKKQKPRSYYRPEPAARMQAITNATALDDLACHCLDAYEHREFSSCQELGESFLKKSIGAETLGTEVELRTIRTAEIHNAMGMSAYQTGQFALAEDYVKRAIAGLGDKSEFYVNLATVRRRVGNKEGERKAISDGLVHCADKRDLEKLASEFIGAERISLCMIVKDEEEMLH